MENDLTELAKKHGTDKWGSHYYTQHYHHFFQQYRDKEFNFLEIGVGGYDDPNAGGDSLRMWKEYFPKAKIFAIDIFDKKPHEEERIKIFKGSQIDHDFLTDVCNEIGTIDIIVDDGSHINSHIIESFEILFPLLSQNGIYAIEDLQTSYWHSFGGDSFNLKNKKTAMNYFKQIIDSLNYEEIDNPSYTPNYYDQNIIGMSFYHNMLFIQKGINNEGSNLIQNNKMPTKNPLKSKFRYFRRRMKSYFSF